MLEERLAALEDEVKVLNNEIKQVLLDIREEVITRFQNPLPEFENGPLDRDLPMQKEPPIAAGPSDEAALNSKGAAPVGEDMLDSLRPLTDKGATPTPVEVAAQEVWDPARPLAGISDVVTGAKGKISGRPEKWEPGKALIDNDPMNTNAEAAVMEAGKTFDDEIAPDDGAEESAEPEKGKNEMETNTDILEVKKNGKNGAKAKSADMEAKQAEVEVERPDLLTVATLSRWLTNGMKQVGRERMEAVIDIYEAMGGISPQLKEILLRLLRIHDGDGAPLTKTMSVLLELDNLQTRNRIDRTDAAVLSLFFNGNGNGHKEVFHR